MIVPMKRVAVFTQAKDALVTIEKLRALGLLHLEHQNLPQGLEITNLQQDLALLSEVIGILSLPEYKPEQPAVEEKPYDWKAKAKHIIDAYKRLDQLGEYSQSLEGRIKEWEIWGGFDPESINNLAAENIFIKLYQIPVSALAGSPKEVLIKKVAVKSGLAYCAVISRQNIELAFKELTLPKMSLAKMRHRLSEDNKLLQEIKKDLKKHSCSLQGFIETKEALLRELEFYQALRGMGQAKNIMYVTGYIPYDKTEVLKQAAANQCWGLFMREPGEEETVPTLIRNPRWISLINPVFKLLEIIPGYRELDISPLFLIFLSLFFGMIIGDAGYGLVYFLLTLFLSRRLKTRLADKRIFYLLYLFSFCAMFWGLLTGTVFGQEWYLKAGSKAFLPLLNNTKFLQAFCFFLGAFHLSLGHLWQAIRKSPSLVALSDLGWICVLWAAFFLAKTLILDAPFPDFGKWLISAGLILVIFFSHPQKNIFKAIASGLGAVALSLMNNFTDVVSYIRLFAIGLAGVAISDTVNTLASSLGDSAILGKILIVFLGHTINIILGPMSVLVHGIRLNVLEFSAHAGLSWSGTVYKPLKA
jgi:V/A-type H+-transporting ATPase subunit I